MGGLGIFMRILFVRLRTVGGEDRVRFSRRREGKAVK
jgi:hypothetical protein